MSLAPDCEILCVSIYRILTIWWWVSKVMCLHISCRCISLPWLFVLVCTMLLSFVLFCWPFSLIYLCMVFNWTLSVLHSMGVKHGLYAYTECIFFLFNLATSYVVHFVIVCIVVLKLICPKNKRRSTQTTHSPQCMEEVLRRRFFGTPYGLRFRWWTKTWMNEFQTRKM